MDQICDHPPICDPPVCDQPVRDQIPRPAPPPHQLVLPITTERLILRDFRLEDAPTMQSYMLEPDHWLYQLIEAPTPDSVRTVIQNILEGQSAPVRHHYVLGVSLKSAPGKIIGEGIISRNTDHANRQGEIGFGLARENWGHGYGTEIARALIGIGFDRMKLHRLSARCSEGNLASVRVMEKTGLRREALLRDLVFAKGRWWGTAIYGILEDEYLNTAS